MNALQVLDAEQLMKSIYFNTDSTDRTNHP